LDGPLYVIKLIKQQKQSKQYKQYKKMNNEYDDEFSSEEFDEQVEEDVLTDSDENDDSSIGALEQQIENSKNHEIKRAFDIKDNVIEDNVVPISKCFTNIVNIGRKKRTVLVEQKMLFQLVCVIPMFLTLVKLLVLDKRKQY